MSKVQHIYSNPDDTLEVHLLAIVIRSSAEFPGRGTDFCTDPNNPLQVGVICKEKGDIVKPHKHVKRRRETETPTQETLFVRSGRLFVSIYDYQDELVASLRLFEKDVIVLMSGHALEFAEDTEIVEVKQGPFKEGQDKVFIS